MHIDVDPTNPYPTPPELEAALDAAPGARARWERVPLSERLHRGIAVGQAKKAETRERRAAAVVEWLLAEIDDASVPPELEAALAADAVARALFDDLTARRRKELSQEVREAKQAETRTRRAAKVVERLHRKEAERVDRVARGTDSPGARFDRVLGEAAGDVLRQAGFRRKGTTRIWIRAREGCTDILQLHRSPVHHVEVASLQLVASVHIARLAELLREPDLGPGRVADAGHPVGGSNHGWFLVDPTVEDDDLRASLLRSVATAIADLDAIDVSTDERLVAMVEEHWRGFLPEVLHGLGRTDEARELLLATVRTRRPPLDADAELHPFHVRAAEAMGVPLAELEATWASAPAVDGRAIVRRLEAELPGVLRFAAVRDDHIKVTLLRPTEAEVAAVHRIVGDVPVDVDAVTHSIDECMAIADGLAPLLLARERLLPELTAACGTCSDGELRVDVQDLDPETEALIRAHVPETVLVLDDQPDPYGLRRLHRIQRHGGLTGGDREGVARRAGPAR